MYFTHVRQVLIKQSNVITAFIIIYGSTRRLYIVGL